MESESEVTFRNHPAIIVQYVLTTAIVLAVVCYLSLMNDDVDAPGSVKELAIGVAAVLLLVTAWSVILWKRTFYIFGENELHVTRDAVFKRDNRIQYTRLASVGVRRSLVDRIFGTSTLMFHVNSSMSAMGVSATLVLRRDIADELRDRLNARIFDKPLDVIEEAEVETLVRVSNPDIVLHAILGQPTYQAIFGLLMLFYAVVMLFVESSGGFLTAVVLLVFSEVIPFVSVIIRYYNYRLYRVGDTVTYECGLFVTTRRSFKVNKVNSVRVREPLVSRIFGKAILEAEVVGMVDDSSKTPVLCPLKGRTEVVSVMETLFPEFVFEPSGVRQPRRALTAMVLTNIVCAAIVVGIFAALVLTAETYLEGESGSTVTIVRATEVAAAAVITLLLFGHSGMAQRHRTFDMGPQSFLFVYGGYDICTEYINYDKVQYASVTSGPIQRALGLAKCSVSLMSSVGFRSVTSGIFEPEDLERVPDEVNARIADGRYDYRKYY